MTTTVVNNHFMNEAPRPTQAELAILRVLWDRSAGTVREVQRILRSERRAEVGYTTVLKLMQRMYEKGLLDRDDSKRPQVYRPSVPRRKTQRRLLGDFLDRVFGGSTKQLVVQLLESKKTSPKDLQEIERVLDRIERERG